MTTYIARRLLVTVPVLFGIILVVFVVGRLLPGDPCHVLLFSQRATNAVCDQFNHRVRLRQADPTTQFTDYIVALSHGDLGKELRTGLPVGDLLISRLPMTVELSIYALLFATTVGILLGVISAYRRNSAVDVVTMAVANLGVSIPVFVLGLVLAYFFAIVLKGTLSLPAVRPADVGPVDHAARRALGHGGDRRADARHGRLPLELVPVQRWLIRSGTSSRTGCAT